jgi:hypothetical protein
MQEQPMRIRWMRAALAAAGTGLIAAAGAAPVSAAATAAVSTHEIPGHEGAISCLTVFRCVAVGSGSTAGQVVDIYKGRFAGSVRVLAQTLTAVSCPNQLGCWAIGPRTGVLNFVEIGRNGTVVRQIAVSGRAVSAAGLNQISCVSMTSCELTDSYFVSRNNVQTAELATWNGRKLRLTPARDFVQLRYVSGPSCSRTSCVVVGAVTSNSVSLAPFVLTTVRGQPRAPSFLSPVRWYLNAVSCASAATCYAIGSGAVVTVTDGVARSIHAGPANWSGIECAGATCWAVGSDTLVKIIGGAVTGAPVTDTATRGFTSIARRKNGFAAVGSSRSGTASVVATG